jgi:hypothetical protein
MKELKVVTNFHGNFNAEIYHIFGAASQFAYKSDVDKDHIIQRHMGISDGIRP